MRDDTNPETQRALGRLEIGLEALKNEISEVRRDARDLKEATAANAEKIGKIDKKIAIALSAVTAIGAALGFAADQLVHSLTNLFAAK